MMAMFLMSFLSLLIKLPTTNYTVPNLPAGRNHECYHLADNNSRCEHRLIVIRGRWGERCGTNLASSRQSDAKLRTELFRRRSPGSDYAPSRSASESSGIVPNLI